jgi:glycosyltransferase involved in cell wall biosynthesis
LHGSLHDAPDETGDSTELCAAWLDFGSIPGLRAWAKAFDEEFKLRIAFLTFEFPDARPGGVGAYVLKCAGALAAIGQEPHIFTLTLPEAVRAKLPDGVVVHEVEDLAQRVESGALPAALAAAAMGGEQASYKLMVGALLCDALRHEHQSNHFDVVEAAECEALALPLLLRPIEELPVVIQIHLGYAANAFGNGVAESERDHLAEGLELATIVGADAVCAATRSVVDVTRKLCPFERDVQIIPYPVDVAASESSLAPGEGAALFVGRLQRRKGCDVLAGAADIFLRRNPAATVRVAGSDTKSAADGASMLAEMMERIDPMVRDRFVYLGELSQAQVRREIEACRFQVVPSVVENFANTAIDAMAAGRTVIYGGNTGLDEVVGDAGIRVWPLTAEKLAEHMELAWKDSALSEKYARPARERVRTRFDAANVSKQRVEFYEQVVAKYEPAPRQWNALSAVQINAVLGALVSQMSETAGLQPAVATPGVKLADRLSEMARKLGRPPNVWLFGAGRFTTRLLGERHRWESRGFSIAGIVDEHPRFKTMENYLGLNVRGPGPLCLDIKGGLRVDGIVLSTDTLEAVFRERVRCFAELGVEILTL